MSQPPRWILVDDTSPDIKYTESSWFAYTGNPISNEVWGLPYQNTVHGTNSSGSLSYNFSGSAVKVRGTAHTQNISGVVNPSWECFVDGIRIDNGEVPGDTLNNCNFCQRNGLDDGPHTLTMSTTITMQQTFWFDRIEYMPSATVPLEHKNLMVSTFSDPAFEYSFGWDNGATNILRSSVSFRFVGTSLIWYSNYTSNYSSSQTTATWSIDGREEKTATLPDHQGGSNTFNQQLFDTGPLSMDTHRLRVVYNGVSSSNTPLTFGYLVIQNGTVSTTVPTSTPTSANSDSRPSHKKLGAVMGGIVGAAVLTIILFFIYRWRRNSTRYKREYFKESTPYVEAPNLRYTYNGGPEIPARPRVTTPINPPEVPPIVVSHHDNVVPNDVPAEGSVIDLPPAYSVT